MTALAKIKRKSMQLYYRSKEVVLEMDCLAMYTLSYSLWSSFFCSWKDQSNAFRKEPGLELRSVPTLLKVGQVIMYFSVWPDSFCIESKICVFAMHNCVVMFNTLMWGIVETKTWRRTMRQRRSSSDVIFWWINYVPYKQCQMLALLMLYIVCFLHGFLLINVRPLQILHGRNE